MFQTIPISAVQKSPKKVFEQKGLTYVLSNNETRGAIIDKDFLAFIEKTGIVTLYEDSLYADDPLINQRSDEVQKIFESGNQDQLLNFDQVFADVQ